MTLVKTGPAANARIAWKETGHDLRACRIEHGMGLRYMARSFGLDKATLSRAERGAPINPATFVWLADWAGHDARDYLAPLYTKSR